MILKNDLLNQSSKQLSESLSINSTLNIHQTFTFYFLVINVLLIGKNYVLYFFGEK